MVIPPEFEIVTKSKLEFSKFSPTKKYIFLSILKSLAMKKLILFLGLAIMLTNCTQEHTECSCLPEPEVLIFGTAYGECLGNCAVLYKIEGSKLYEDDVTYLTSSADIKFKTTPLASEKYLMAKVLLAEFPFQILDEDKERFGCPDCADQGTFYLEYRLGDTARHWYIDTNDDAIPAYLVAYTDRIAEIMQALQ